MPKMPEAIMTALDLEGQGRRAAQAPQSVAPRPVAPLPPARRLGFFAAIRAMLANPITAFSEQAYEASFLEVRRWTGVMLVNDPKAIVHILVGNAENYGKSIQQQRRLRPGLGDGLLTAEGETWRATRRITSPLFNPRAVALLFDDMRLASEAMRERWLERPEPEAALDLASEFHRLTYEIVSRTVFSGDLDQDRLLLQANMAVYFDSIGRISLSNMYNLPRWLPTPSARRGRPALGLFRSVVDRVVTGRVGLADREISDLLDRLMRTPDPETGKTLTAAAVSDNVLTFLAAGHETTANSLAWILYLLALFPQAEQAVADELAATFAGAAPTREGLDRLVFTRAVVSEAMRLYPPAPFIGRQALADDMLAGRKVKAGTQIVISPWILHRHRRLWEEPDAFRPERFLPASAPPERGAYIPFGLGPRICIGQGFAIQEIMAVLATIVPAFRFRLADPAAVFPRANITLRPINGVPMIVTPR